MILYVSCFAFYVWEGIAGIIPVSYCLKLILLIMSFFLLVFIAFLFYGVLLIIS